METHLSKTVQLAREAGLVYLSNGLWWMDAGEASYELKAFEALVRADEHPAAQRQWVELTFAEICECENDYLHLFARAIEAKLKEKNT
jgi:hypothetical protein